MQRRDFLRNTALAWAGWSVARSAMGQAPGSTAADFPIVVSTWDFGKAANQEAYRQLAAGHSALDAAVRGVKLVEEDPEVQSVGYGGLPNRDGVVELDAAVMDGATLEIGAVAGMHEIKHAASVAQRVLDRTPHAMLVGEGAQRFALSQGFVRENLLTEQAQAAWQEAKSKGNLVPDGHDTIGTIVRGVDGRMAAACTTSGMAWKMAGRVGDSPLIGAGIYCDQEAGGAVATGAGEEVIRVCGSYQVVEFMRQGIDPGVAIRRVLQRIVRRAKDTLPFVGFTALRADGMIGHGSTKAGFQAAVSQAGRHEIVDAPFLTVGQLASEK
jgi:N4-(beta-N-acetylglucosaminyl)-L-asparaginase